MIPERLYLKGFAGIRAGLKRDELTLDLTELPGEASLVAIAGPNGTGKTSVMDNLQPYRMMPARATSLSPNGFSFYEHLVLPECVKELVWRHDGKRYRSALVFRTNGRRKAEAYLHVEHGGQWVPVKLADGTVSDGKAETYDACVEALLGNSESYFSSVFAAQNRRPLPSYTNAEIKGLMVELLGLDRIREAGEKASQVARLVKNTLQERRHILHSFGDIEGRIAATGQSLASCAQELDKAVQAKRATQSDLEAVRQRLATLTAEREGAADVERRRRALATRLAETKETASKASAALDQDRIREESRIARAKAQLHDTLCEADKRRFALARSRGEARSVLAQKDAIGSAIERASTVGSDEARLREALQAAQAQHRAREEAEKTLAVLRAEANGLRQKAGDAALRADSLKKRFGLTDEVPCRGTELQPRCKLLADAHEAKVVMPSADAAVARIREAFDTLSQEIRALETTLHTLGDTAAGVCRAQGQLDQLIDERRSVEALAALAGSLKLAEQRLAECEATEEAIRAAVKVAQDRRTSEVEEAQKALAAIAERAREVEKTRAASVKAIEAELASLPPAPDLSKIAAAQQAFDAARKRADEADALSLRLAQQEATLKVELESAQAKSTEAARAKREVTRLDAELGWWNLLSKALGNDGVIALCVDDAGPELARLANELLLACYGPRFTMSIRTQIETAKKELREGFDVVVYDAESGAPRSVTVMSGGERVWIHETLTRAIALYLARASGRRYETLFCDEADGALDSDRKRMFMQMKREVLRLGGYSREFFISQTPELTHMADAVIDLAAARMVQSAAVSLST